MGDTRMRTILTIIFLISGIVTNLTGCSTKETWHEEVRLSTGDTITIDREVKHGGGGAAWPQGQGSIPREHLIRIKSSVKNETFIEWRSTKLDSSTYAELPLVLDVDADNEWIIFTKLSLSGGACTQYLKYKYTNGKWVEVRLSDDVGVHPTNLLLSAGGIDNKGVITLAEKTVENSFGYSLFVKQVGPKKFACRYNYTGPYPPRGAIEVAP